ncbi:MAG: hypothetical protein ABI605_04990 [Rhizobacter sp.]
MPPAWDRTRVTKKLSPKQQGARKLAQRYGSALVCVRHRQDEGRAIRYTTVELLIEQAPIVRRKPRSPLLCVKLEAGEFELRRRIIAAGGQWDAHAYAWRLTQSAVTRLRLSSKVVGTDMV